MKNKINVLAILIFCITIIALRYLTNKTDLLEGLPSNFLKVILQVTSSTIGAVAAFYLFKINPALNLKGKYGNISTPFFLYWAVPVVLITVAAYLIKGTTIPVAVISILLYGLLEEIGWRGFLQRELKTLPEFFKILLVATLWFSWHLNFNIIGSNLLFFAILILGSWGIGKVADRTHSLLAVSAFHSLNNFFPAMDTTKIIRIVTLLITWITSLLITKKSVNQTVARLSTTSV